ncbi:MAG TPA: nitrilase-related carbon-nitrogen hydrolase, partial [Blastocatellia bacterium]
SAASAIPPTAQIRTASSKVALIHFNPNLGDVRANVQSLNAYVEEAFQSGANIIVTPELATTGYSITTDQVIKLLGMESPFPQLSRIRDLAIQYRGYVFLALAEKSKSGRLYNSVAVFGPDGLITTQRKRGMATWNARGDVPFEVIKTPYGDLGTIICSDSYLPDWPRVLTLKGADIIVSPANWWGDFGQEEIWQTRARENGVWYVVANRWGTEIDKRFDPPYTYEMNDAPSDIIDPDGTILLSYRAKESSSPGDKILYYTIQVPIDRIGSASSSTSTVIKRKPAAYYGIANEFYRPDLGNRPPPGIPPAGLTRAGVIAYLPSSEAKVNLLNVKRLWDKAHADAIVLPGLGITQEPIESFKPQWHRASPWGELQEFVDRHGILLLATTVFEKSGKGKPARESVLVFRRKKPARLYAQTHDYGLIAGSNRSPATIDLPHARVAVLTGRDFLFPELSTSLAKKGVDLMLVPSSICNTKAMPAWSSVSGIWNKNALLQAWRTSANHGFHLAAADMGGFGLMVQEGGGFPVRKEILDSQKPMQVLDLDSRPTRSKYLNAYHPFDLETLLSVPKRAAAKRS